jgi:hypothetical protein
MNHMTVVKMKANSAIEDFVQKFYDKMACPKAQHLLAADERAKLTAESRTRALSTRSSSTS